VDYTVIWRRAAGTACSPDRDATTEAGTADAGASSVDAGTPCDTVIVAFHNQFAASPTGAALAGQYDGTAQGMAVPSSPGDQLVLRLSLAADSPASSRFIPYGELPSSASMRWITLHIP
jgi:hypothetical protein